MSTDSRLVLVSNRVPPIAATYGAESGEGTPVGGLVTLLRPLLTGREVLWFGWSGKRTPRASMPPPTVTSLNSGQLAMKDIPGRDANLYYTIFSNQVLWPLLHNFPDKIVIRHDAYSAYRRVNREFAQELFSMLWPDDLIWVHDYHLIPLGAELRELGWKGRIGFFLHVPFPPADTFSLIPWSRDLLENLLSYDLIGLHTRRYVHNLFDTLAMELRGAQIGESFALRDQTVRIKDYAAGTDPELFREYARKERRGGTRSLLRRIGPNQRIFLGVDRMDYTKGVPERLLAFERLLMRHASVRGKVSMVQISAPTRERVPANAEIKGDVDRLVGRINGKFSELGWSPIHFLFRSYDQRRLATLFGEAEVCLVTPLRDGMNLVAKEYVASRPDDPGVLVLSRFCGAADKMTDALIVNPRDIDDTADALYHALHMPEDEKRQRWEALTLGIRTDTAETWSHGFLSDLAA